MVDKANSAAESDELLCLWDSTQNELEENYKRGQAELERMGPERAGWISNWLKEHEDGRRTNKKRKRTSEEEQQQIECKLKDARQLKEELLWCSGKFSPGWMTIDRCIRVCLPKQVADHAECMRQWRWDLLDSVAFVRKHNSMFYFGIAACPYNRATNLDFGHVRNFDVMNILAYGPSRMMGDFEDFLIKYSWMQSDEIRAPCCLNQRAGRGGQGTQAMEGYLYMAEREREIDDHDLKTTKARQKFLENVEERRKIQQMLDELDEIRSTRSNTNTDATTNDADTDPDTDTDSDATTNDSVRDAM